MDDFNISTLHESKSEWASRLLILLTPLIIEGLKSIFDESFKLCRENKEETKYLMTFQNFISRIPKWSATVIEQERKRIVDKSRCNYLEDLITCVHIIQLKLLTAMRVGTKQRKIDVNIPKLDDFIHKCYIAAARKVYKNVYLFELGLPPLQVQKHNRELEVIVQECILNTIRESIPVETILKAYMDETVEEDVVEEIKEEEVEEPVEEKGATTAGEDSNNSSEKNNESSRIKFNDVDTAIGTDNKEELVNAPKSIERLEEISEMRNQQRKLEEEEDDDDNGSQKIKIFDQPADLGSLGIEDISVPTQPSSSSSIEEFHFDDIEVLA